MKLYNRKLHRYIERPIHFGIGKSIETACGVTLFSRHVMVSIHSDFNGEMITSDFGKVTCKRCLKTREVRLRRLLEIEATCPGVLDHPSLCGKDWIMAHALDITQPVINRQQLVITIGARQITLTSAMKSKDRKYVISSIKSVSP